MEENTFIGIFHVEKDLWLISKAIATKDSLSLFFPLMIEKGTQKSGVLNVSLKIYSPYSEPTEEFIFDNFISISYPTQEMFDLYIRSLTALYPELDNYDDSDNNNEEESNNGKTTYH